MFRSMATWVVNAFYIRIDPWKFGEKKKKIKIDKILLKVTKVKKYMISTKVE